MMQVMTLTCNAIIVNKLRSTKGRFLLEKRLFKAAVKWCLEQVSEGFQGFFFVLCIFRTEPRTQAPFICALGRDAG